MVIPCGREDGQNSEDEMPYELHIKKKGTTFIYHNPTISIANDNSLKEIFMHNKALWEKVYQLYLPQGE